MPKRIVLCCDGTADNPASRTNVHLLFAALPTTANQVKFYADGVGAEGNFFVKVAQDALGLGLRHKVKEGYASIAHVYEEGDEIYIFGFSRGGFAARSIAGMIAACGLPTKNFSDSLVDTVFKAYMHKGQREQILEKLSDNAIFRATITMVGVWDTVGSLGLASALGGVDPIDEFLDTNLHPSILNGYQALAIDEKRPQFQPELWNVATPGQTLQQVWFSGFHSDVGGGVKEIKPGSKALSDIPLAWMINKASQLGLQFDPDVAKLYALPIDQSYALLPLNPPNKGFNQVEPRTIFDGATLADSVVVRSQDPKLRPHNLKFVNGVLSSSYPIEKVVTAQTAVLNAASVL